MKHRNLFAMPYVLWMILFTIVPFFLMAYYALSIEGTFSLDNIRLFMDPIYLDVLVRSLRMAFICTLICLALGYPAAYFLASKDFNSIGVLAVLFVLPMWMNFLLRTYAWMALLEDSGLINRVLLFLHLPKAKLLYTENAVLMGMVYNYLPFMILPLLSVLKKMDHRLIEAAEDLGAGRRQVFMRVTLPLSVPGIVSGITMVFMPAVTTFVISRLLGGSMFMLFGDLIEQQFLVTGNWNFGAALSMVMMLLILLSMAILRYFESSATEGGNPT